PKVVVQAPGLVTLDDEARITVAISVGVVVARSRHRFAGPARIALRAIRGEAVTGCAPTGTCGLRGSLLPRGPPRLARAQDGLGRVTTPLHSLQHLVEAELPQVGRGEFSPGAGSRNPSFQPAAQRVRRDRSLRGVVLTPVDEYLPGAQR